MHTLSGAGLKVERVLGNYLVANLKALQILVFGSERGHHLHLVASLLRAHAHQKVVNILIVIEVFSLEFACHLLIDALDCCIP